MQEICSKDPAIKLFGRKIPLTSDGDPPPISSHGLPPLERAQEDEEKAEKKDFPAEVTESRQEDGAPIQVTEECEDPETSAETSVNPKTPSINEESAKSNTSQTEKEENDAANTQGKTLKKPDKILPCPRCNSVDTKFCYYNNYNINQPRHFCKACQRYWTAGGTMRNVPVGAGRRKNKNSASHYRHITISEALQAAHMESPTGTHSPRLKTNGRVLSFGLDQPICDSMAFVLNLADKKAMKNGHHLEEPRIPVACRGRENGGGDDCSSGSSVTVSNSMEERGRTCSQEPYMQSINGFGSPIPCLPGVPWPYPWGSTLPPPPPAFCPPGFPISFYPPIWNCGIAAAGGWNIPLLSPQSSSNQKTTLGKHSRNGETVKPYETEKEEPENHRIGCVLVPKILRIDDPAEAAKSSIWATLGIKNESLTGGKLFKAFQPKSEEKNHIVKTSPVLMANPAALSRSINFHESS